MILSKILLCARILAVARSRSFIYTIVALGEIRALRRFDFSFFRAGGFVQAAGGLFSLLGRCVLNAHGFLHRGCNAAVTNERWTSNVPKGEAMELGQRGPGKARTA